MTYMQRRRGEYPFVQERKMLQVPSATVCCHEFQSQVAIHRVVPGQIQAIPLPELSKAWRLSCNIPVTGLSSNDIQVVLSSVAC
ncbi:hypothetical protein Ae201684_010303 [Aphanomyces euteiches]|uniref:Uncharacterized protein n=1 Tax=Aphanomyces euteiches TaxID=100861 RepID=A0A6G0WYJ9_9STRA|nr:hypothetical protein Ae201684_010303 [Aphanomyces euteiches]